MQQVYQSSASALRDVYYASHPIAFVVSSWTRISYTSDSLSDSSLRQGAQGAGSDWVDGRT